MKLRHEPSLEVKEVNVRIVKAKTVFTTILVLYLIVTSYFAYLWLASNKHYFKRVFNVRAMNVEKKIVEVSVK